MVDRLLALRLGLLGADSFSFSFWLLGLLFIPRELLDSPPEKRLDLFFLSQLLCVVLFVDEHSAVEEHGQVRLEDVFFFLEKNDGIAGRLDAEREFFLEGFEDVEHHLGGERLHERHQVDVLLDVELGGGGLQL